MEDNHEKINALVKKCMENDTIDIMQYVRDVKREIEVEFERD